MPDQQDQGSWKPKYNPWAIALVVALAAFMEVLDTSIANVALPHISGGLGAGQDQSTWVLTTYLVANAIVLPTTGWISSVVGRKRFFLACIALFTASSVLCGLAPTLPFLLLARVLQGAAGGGLQPMAQAIMADVFPPEKRGQAFALYGLTAVMAPALGPTLGGWITDSYSWRWIFWINVPVGLLAIALVFHMVEDPPFLTRKTLAESKFDYIGFSALALGIAALQIVLDKGQEDDWLGSPFIATLCVVAIVGLGFMVLWEWFEKEPIVEVRLFKVLNFTTSSLMMFVVGLVSFSSTILMPQYLQNLMGYTAEKAGLVVSAGAAVLLLVMPLVGFLTSKVALKYLMALGWLLSAVGLYISTNLISLQISFKTAAMVMLVQYVPLGFIFIPATTAAYIGVPQGKTDAVSGLVNFMRNLGSSVGTSVAQTIVTRRQQFHMSRLSSHTTMGSPNFVRQLQAMTNSLQAQNAGLGMMGAQRRGLGQFYQIVMSQASSLSYVDAYALLGWGAALMFMLSFALNSNDPAHTEQQAG